jgi:hypothetical protein
MAVGQLVGLLSLTTAWVWKVGYGIARIVAVAHSNARNCLLYSGLTEILKQPSDTVPVCEDYKRIAGSGAYLKSFVPAPNSFFSFFSFSLALFFANGFVVAQYGAVCNAIGRLGDVLFVVGLLYL